MHYQGKLYRALNPVYAHEPLSGHGAKLHGGRFNLKGTPALYLSSSFETAIRETNQSGSFQPTTLVAYQADIENVFDSRSPAAFEGFTTTKSDLSDDSYRDHIKRGTVSPTQQFALALIAAGYQGLLVRSFALGARQTEMNLVLWTWGNKPPATLTVTDDEGRLQRA